jgi:hypothetical protein
MRIASKCNHMNQRSTSPRPPTAEAIAQALRWHASHELLALMVKGGANDRTAGRKALLLAYLLDPELIGTQTQLAGRMGVSQGRTSQMLKSIRANLLRNSAKS